MKNKKLFSVVLVSTVIFFFVFVLVNFTFKNYLKINENLSWNKIISNSIIPTIIFSFAMYYFMKRKLRSDKFMPSRNNKAS